jgi:hypothetical protein
VKGSEELTPPWTTHAWTARARLPGLTAAEEAAVEVKVATLRAISATVREFDATHVMRGAAIRAAVIASDRASIDDAIGRAMAAILLDKPQEAVTKNEVLAALAKPFAKKDPERTNRAQRAGILALAKNLDSHLVHHGFAGLIVDVVNRLDAGEWRKLGWATPAKTTRRGSPGVEAEEALWFAIEIAFLKAAYDVNIDKAIGLATGVWRSGTGGRKGRPATNPAPTMPARTGWGRTKIQRLIQLGEKNKPDDIADARRQGKAARTGNVDPDFFVIRRNYLATWAAKRLQSASCASPEAKQRRGTPRRTA